MTGVLQFSTWIYERLLFLYPAELRRDFGSEMALAFAADLEDCGPIRVWRCALRELLTVALPSQRSSPYFLSPVLAFLTTAFAEGALVWIAIHQPHVDVNATQAMWLAVPYISSMNAVVAFVVTCFYSRCSFNLLRLD
jgi:hypothetical protein